MKGKFTLLLLLYGVLILRGAAQIPGSTLCEGDFTLSSQAEVDAFNCTEITGTLWISGEDITDLSPLQNLTKVGILIITECPNLINVDGLSGLREITRKDGMPYVLGISGNAKLKNIDGLDNLTATTMGSMSISNNPALESINALSSVQTVFGLFSIANNPSLKSINGFRNITEMRDYGFQPYLLIEGNPSLTNVDGFSSLTSIRGNGANLDIRNNSALTSLEGFSSLEFLSGGGRGTGVFIVNNDAIKNIDGFRTLSGLGYGIAGAVEISENDSLENVNGIANLKVDAGPGRFFFTVSKNPALTDCSAIYPFLVHYGLSYIDSNFIVAENGSGCTLEDIIANGPPAVTGFRLYDKQTGTPLSGDFYQNQAYFDIANPAYGKQAVRALTNPAKTGSVVFKIDNITTITDNEFPYELDLVRLSPGIHSVTASIYSKRAGQGISGIGRTATINVTNSAFIGSFDVVDLSGNVITSLQDGGEIDLNDPALKAFTIKANVYPEVVNNVKFWLNNKLVRKENVAPYALNGDTNGQYHAWYPKPGTYTLRAIPYVKPGSREFAGQPLEISFTVVAEPLQAVARASSSVALSLYPVPMKDDLHVAIANASTENYSIALRNNHGVVVYKGVYNAQSEGYSIKTSDLPAGVYFLQVRGSNGFEKVMRIVK